MWTIQWALRQKREFSRYTEIFSPAFLKRVHLEIGTEEAEFVLRTIGRGQAIAVTLGSTIYAQPDSSILQDPSLLAHELAHVKQWEQEGAGKFTISYIVQYFRVGYEKVSFEKEAVAIEKLVEAYLELPRGLFIEMILAGGVP